MVATTARTIAVLVGFLWTVEAAPSTTGRSVCTTFVGPAFIIPDESSETIAVHAGSFRGVSVLSLTTGHVEGRIPISQAILAALVPRASGQLVLALSDTAGLRVSSFDIASRRLTSTELLRGIDAEHAVFAPRGKLLLGVTRAGTVFKVGIAERKIEETKGSAPMTASLAVSPTSTKLYLAGDGVTIIDLGSMTMSSVITEERGLLEVAASPNGNTLVVRNWRGIELFNAVGAKAHDAFASAVVDTAPNGASISLTSRLALSEDGSSLFYIRASDVEPQLISMSMNDLHIEARVPVGPYPNAVAVVPARRWVLVTAGTIDDQYLEAIDMKTRMTIFKAALKGRPSALANACEVGLE